MRIPARTARKAKNSVVLNAALVSVERRRGRAMGVWRSLVAVTPFPVRVLMKSSEDSRGSMASDCLRSVAHDQRLPPEGESHAVDHGAAASAQRYPGAEERQTVSGGSVT